VPAAAPCPLCGAAGRPRLCTRDRNRGISRERFHYRTCQDCEALFLADRPEDLSAYYPPAYYAPPDPAGALSVATERAKLAFLERHMPRGRLVEIGPGAGGFALAASMLGYEVTAVEMDPTACARLEAVGIEAIRSDRPDRALADLGPVQAVCMWQVIEHLADPWSALAAAAEALAPGGVLVMSTPNPDSLQLRLLGSRWPHLDAPRHLVLIPIPALRQRARELGLEMVELTSCDRTANDWNAFGWAELLTGPRTGPRLRRLAFLAGAAAALVLAPLERRGLNGSSYTAVLRRRP